MLRTSPAPDLSLESCGFAGFHPRHRAAHPQSSPDDCDAACCFLIGSENQSLDIIKPCRHGHQEHTPHVHEVKPKYLLLVVVVDFWRTWFLLSIISDLKKQYTISLLNWFPYSNFILIFLIASNTKSNRDILPFIRIYFDILQS